MTTEEMIEKYGDEYDKVFNNVDTAKERLEEEFKDLKEKTHKLADFLINDKFQIMSREQQNLLNMQYELFRTLWYVFDRRLEIWQD